MHVSRRTTLRTRAISILHMSCSFQPGFIILLTRLWSLNWPPKPYWLRTWTPLETCSRHLTVYITRLMDGVFVVKYVASFLPLGRLLSNSMNRRFCWTMFLSSHAYPNSKTQLMVATTNQCFPVLLPNKRLTIWFDGFRKSLKIYRACSIAVGRPTVDILQLEGKWLEV